MKIFDVLQICQQQYETNKHKKSASIKNHVDCHLKLVGLETQNMDLVFLVESSNKKKKEKNSHKPIHEFYFIERKREMKTTR